MVKHTAARTSVVRWRNLYSSFFFNDTATTEIYTLSLHDALPICLLCPETNNRNYFPGDRSSPGTTNSDMTHSQVAASQLAARKSLSSNRGYRNRPWRPCNSNRDRRRVDSSWSPTNPERSGRPQAG